MSLNKLFERKVLFVFGRSFWNLLGIIGLVTTVVGGTTLIKSHYESTESYVSNNITYYSFESSYEDFIFNQEMVFLKLLKKMKFLKVNNNMISHSHEIGGNDGFVKGKTEKLIYQYNWIFSYSVFSPLISLILDPIQFLIRKLSKK